MCTVLLRLAPDSPWPVQLAFVRDEDRSRPTDPPDAWWPRQPTVIGGRDVRAGGTWLAVDTASPGAIALVTNRYDPVLQGGPMKSGIQSRGQLPLLALERGGDFDLDDVPGGVGQYAPFHLVTTTPYGDGWRVERRSWSGDALDHELLAPGIHVVASRETSIPGEAERRARLSKQLTTLPIHDIDVDAPTESAWPGWVDPLDARHARPDEFDHVAVNSVTDHPGFGTVGATLVALSADGRLRYDINASTSLDPTAWSQAQLVSA